MWKVESALLLGVQAVSTEKNSEHRHWLLLHLNHKDLRGKFTKYFTTAYLRLRGAALLSKLTM